MSNFEIRSTSHVEKNSFFRGLFSTEQRSIEETGDIIPGNPTRPTTSNSNPLAGHFRGLGTYYLA